MGMMAVASLGSFGCGSSRDVEVSGDVAAPTSAQGKIVVEFYDNHDDKWTQVHSIELAKAGSFSEKVSLEGDQVRVRAIADSDGNGACTAGEAWQQIDADVSKDDKASVSLSLAATACPEPAE
jgi:hypothetical protein